MVVIRKKSVETPEEKEERAKKSQEQAMGIQDDYQARGFELVTWIQEQKTLVSLIIIFLILGCGLFAAKSHRTIKAIQTQTRGAPPCCLF